MSYGKDDLKDWRWESGLIKGLLCAEGLKMYLRGLGDG